jgi:hypothetical protein
MIIKLGLATASRTSNMCELFGQRGVTPLTVVALRTKLDLMWKSIGRRGITSLGKGFFFNSFFPLLRMLSVRAVNSWKLNHGFLKLFPWTKDFNPSLQKQSFAQVWMRVFMVFPKSIGVQR